MIREAVTLEVRDVHQGELSLWTYMIYLGGSYGCSNTVSVLNFSISQLYSLLLDWMDHVYIVIVV
jgi:hypothetical protein